MKAVILVGGFGSRLMPLTADTPKQMLHVAGLTMLERVLEQLRHHGVQEAILSLGYKPEVFMDAYPDGLAQGIRLSYAVEQTPLDTGGAIRWAIDQGGIDEPFLVVNGDVLTDLDIGALMRFHEASAALATIALVPVDDPSRYGVVSTNHDGRVLEFIEKPDRDSAPTNLINAGTYVLDPEALSSISSGEVASIEREIFPLLASQNALFALPSDEYWIDAGTPLTLLRAGLDVLEGRRLLAEIPGECLDNGSRVSRDAQISPEASFEMSYVGPHAMLFGDASIRGSVIESRGVVEDGAVVVNSIVFPGARVCEGSVVDGSIIGPGAVVPGNSMVLGGSVIARQAELLAGCRLEGERVPS